jgi:hypothetical protein
VVKHAVSICFTSALLSASLGAQRSGAWEISAQAMVAPSGSTPNSVFGGQAEGIRQQAVAIRATTDLLRLGNVRLRYSAQVLPYMQLGDVERYAELRDEFATTYIITGTTNSIGVGFVPIGLDLAVTLVPRVRVQAGAGVGITRFSQHVPVAGGRQRNFSAEWDGQFAFDMGGERWLQLGLRWKHISNGLTAYENPGIDNRMLYAGMSWRVRAPR